MRRALLVVCLLAAVAQAAPKYDRAAITSTNPAWVAAEKVWTAAAAETDPATATTAWERTAAAFVAIAEDVSVARATRQEAAYAAILAWKNALDVDPRVTAPRADADVDKVPAPQPLDARETSLLHTIDVYLALSPPPGEAAEVTFMRATTLRKRARYAEAIPIYIDILEHHRDHEVAEYAANLVLDAYNILQRYEEMIAFAARLRADKAFLANKPDLADTLRRIHTQAMRVRGGNVERTARETKDLAKFDACGEEYLAVADEPGVWGSEQAEALYNAGVCFHQAGSMTRALATYRLLIKKHPSSSLGGRAMARLGKAEADIAHYREAIDALEQYARRYSGEKDAADATSDAVYYARAIGDLPRATKLADFAIKTFGAKKPALLMEALLVILDAQLAAGDRTEGARRATAVMRNGAVQRTGDPALALRAARLVANAACPVALVDDLCPRPRDRTLVTGARRMLAVIRGATDNDSAVFADVASQLALDLDLETVLATPQSIVGADGSLAGYQRLATSSTSPQLRVVAHARLGTLHRHLGDRPKALSALRACVSQARTTMQGSEWLARCERDLAAMKEPDLDILPERFAPPAAGAVITVEAYGTAQVPR